MSDDFVWRVPPPIAISMIVCEQIWIDRSTDKICLQGCFTTIESVEFPACHPSVFVCIELTNGQGNVPVELTVYRTGREESPIYEQELDVDFQDITEVRQASFELGALEFPEEGE